MTIFLFPLDTKIGKIFAAIVNLAVLTFQITARPAYVDVYHHSWQCDPTMPFREAAALPPARSSQSTGPGKRTNRLSDQDGQQWALDSGSFES